MLPSGAIARQHRKRDSTSSTELRRLCALFWSRSPRPTAHPEYAPSTVNRYIKIDLVGPDELRLAPTPSMVGPAPAAAWRRAADGNANGLARRRRDAQLGEQGRAGGARRLLAHRRRQARRAGVRRAERRTRRQRGRRQPASRSTSSRASRCRPPPSTPSASTTPPRVAARRDRDPRRGVAGDAARRPPTAAPPTAPPRHRPPRPRKRPASSSAAPSSRPSKIARSPSSSPPPPPPLRRPHRRGLPWFLLPALAAAAIAAWFLRKPKRT